MGACSTIHDLDYRVLRGEVAPALRRLVAGPAGIAEPAWLSDLLKGEMSVCRKSTIVPMFGECEALRPDLGLRDENSVLLTLTPVMAGACRSADCAGIAHCILHPSGDGVELAERFNALVQMAYVGHCCGQSRVLGRDAQWHHFQDWYAMELGEDGWEWTDSVAYAHVGRDPVLALLLRLSKRGAAIGWADGGFGEGLLGWLDPDETSRLAAGLAAYDLTPTAPIPEVLKFADPYMATDYLPEMRRVMTHIRSAASQAVSAGSGLALTRG